MNLRNPMTTNINSYIDCEIEYQGEWLPYTTRPDDEPTEGAYYSLLNEDFGPVEILPQPPEPVPQFVTPVQFRRALRATDWNGETLHKRVKDYIAQLPEEEAEIAQEEWDAAVVIERDEPMILAAATWIGLNEDDIDDLFTLAATK